jgi:hypothetical protein
MIYFDAWTCKNLQKIRTENLLSRLTLTDPRSKFSKSADRFAANRLSKQDLLMLI